MICGVYQNLNYLEVFCLSLPIIGPLRTIIGTAQVVLAVPRAAPLSICKGHQGENEEIPGVCAFFLKLWGWVMIKCRIDGVWYWRVGRSTRSCFHENLRIRRLFCFQFVEETRWRLLVDQE